jgi:4-diphosphocytidyl-2-C-methyl-D-erythritol kinase
VGDRRNDGYHELASLVAFTEAGDDLLAEAADGLSLTVDGPFAADCPLGEDNLVLKAARALRVHSGMSVGAHLRLTKNLPVASGIGGGSTDAAAALITLNQLWRTGASRDDLARIGLGLGADVPVCIKGQTSIIRGIGERIDLAPSLPPVPVVLVNPGVPVSTADIFRRLTIRSGAKLPDLPDTFASGKALADWLAQTRNDLEPPSRLAAPVIGVVLSMLSVVKGCLLARMSGSGATCFGLCETDALAAGAAASLSQEQPSWWVLPTRLRAN